MTFVDFDICHQMAHYKNCFQDRYLLLKVKISNRDPHIGERPHRYDEFEDWCTHSSSIVWHKLTHSSKHPFKCDDCRFKCDEGVICSKNKSPTNSSQVCTPSKDCFTHGPIRLNRSLYCFAIEGESCRCLQTTQILSTRLDSIQLVGVSQGRSKPVGPSWSQLDPAEFRWTWLHQPVENNQAESWWQSELV